MKKSTRLSAISSLFTILFVVLLLCTSVPFVKAADMTQIENTNIKQWDGYMINNIVIDLDIVAVADNESSQKSSAKFSVWEWKNDTWTNIKNLTLSGENKKQTFNALNSKFELELISISPGTEGGNAFVKISTDMTQEIYKKGSVSGGHKKISGAGKPDLKITKRVNRTKMSVDDVIEVTVFVENVGKYDAYNVSVTDSTQSYFVRLDEIINDTQIKTLEQKSNRTVLMYRMKAAEPGNFSLSDVSIKFENGANQTFTLSKKETTNMIVDEQAYEKPKIEIQNIFENKETEALTGKIEGKIIIKNTGEAPAENLRVDFLVPGANISGEKIENDQIFIVSLLPNEEKQYIYKISSKEAGIYTGTINYTYTFDTKKGPEKASQSVEPFTFSVNENKIYTNIKSVPIYLWIIPVLIIAAAAYFVWKRHREYKF